jgi:hypothetical protein
MFCLPLILALLGALGCVDDAGGGGGIYVFDNGSRSVLVWKEMDKLYEAARDGKETPKAERTITSGNLPKDFTLAWGGLALDDSHNRLYLVSESGKVFVIHDPRTQKGDISKNTEITSFNLGSAGTDHFNSGSVFGQATVDPAKNILYVMENAKNGEAARIWHVGNASAVPNGKTLEKQGHTLPGENSQIEDKWGAGVVAASGHKVYGLFGNGKDFEDNNGHAITGPRLREGSAGSFPANPGHNHPINTLVGNKQHFPKPFKFGSLAFDRRHHALYAFVPAAKAPKPKPDKAPDAPEPDGVTKTPEQAQSADEPKSAILVFGEGQFHGSHDQAPKRVLADVPEDLRIIVHPLDADWMLGAAFTPAAGKADKGKGKGKGQGQGKGQKTLYMWKSPSEGGKPVKVPGLPGVSEIRGIAVGND